MSGSRERLAAALADRYRIERELGQGGMATVYLAQDLKHGRKVALKVLRPELSAILGAERFLAEIKTTANLQHPHILGLFDSGEADGMVFYAMPFVEGESLRDRLNRERQLPVPEAIALAREVADALEYAHRQGIVHRDIKPENILLQGGHAVVADFGIALAAAQSDGGQRMTETGMSLGTPHYMSPEQAMGERDITPKADIYALGCVLYEMLTAEPPFQGASAQAIIARVLTEEPRSLTAQRNTIPPNVEAAVRTALAKLPADRFATAKAFADALASTDFSAQGALSGQSTSHREATPAAPARARPVLPWVVAAAGLLVSAWALTRSSGEAPPPVARFRTTFAPEVATNQNGQVFALSPDGARVVYVGVASLQLQVRNVDQLESTPIPGSENSLNPFFSPDGEHVAFTSGTRLLRVALSGGPTLPVAEIGGSVYGGTWNARGEILYGSGLSGLNLVSASGGQAVVVAAPDSSAGESYRWPEFLPGGKAAVFAIFDGREDHLAVVDLRSGKVKRLGLVGSNPHFVQQGYLVYTLIRADGGPGTGTLLAVAFDPDKQEVRGSSVPLSDSVQVGVNSRSAKLGISPRGSIVFAAGAIGQAKLVSIAMNGAVTDLGSEDRFYQAPRLSPDGRRVATQVITSGNDIWVFERTTRTLTRRTFDGSARFPIWSPDGRRIAYSRFGRTNGLAWIAADGSAPAEDLTTARHDQVPGVFTPDGRQLLLRETINGRLRISVLSLDSSRTLAPLIDNNYDNHSPTLSSDGRWLAYVSNETGRSEIYVRPFPSLGGKWQVSRDGGMQPRWSASGREIYFRNGDAMMAASVQAGDGFSAGAVRQLFRAVLADNFTYTNYDLTADGGAFLAFQATNQGSQELRTILNWFDHPPRTTR